MLTAIWFARKRLGATEEETRLARITDREAAVCARYEIEECLALQRRYSQIGGRRWRNGVGARAPANLAAQL
jgi:hypothetical protein